MSKQINIYLDVDGVLISEGKPANYLDKFIAYLDTNHDGCIYWLTTHCQGSTEAVMAYMRAFIDNDVTLAAMVKFKHTKWDMAKTEAIDFTKPFLWFDDNLLYGEKANLNQSHTLENMILVDLRKNPNSLGVYVEDFPVHI